MSITFREGFQKSGSVRGFGFSQNANQWNTPPEVYLLLIINKCDRNLLISLLVCRPVAHPITPGLPSVGTFVLGLVSVLCLVFNPYVARIEGEAGHGASFYVAMAISTSRRACLYLQQRSRQDQCLLYSLVTERSSP